MIRIGLRRGLLCAALASLIVTWTGIAPAAAADPPVMRAGGLAGPVEVRGGDRLGVVARLALSRGSWTVLAKGVLRNTTERSTARPVRCRLAIGGSSDQVLASPMRRDRGDSRQAVVLTHAAHLTGRGAATLRCGAPGSATGVVVIEGIRMVAFRTASLFVRREGHHGTFHGDPGSTSQVRLLVGNSSLVATPRATVATLPLPAGRWAITAKASLVRTSMEDTALIMCTLAVDPNDGEPDDALTYGMVTGSGHAGDRIPIALEATHSAGGPFDALLACDTLTGTGTTRIRDIRLTAYRATALASQELNPGAVYSPFPDWMQPVLYAGHADGLDVIPADAGYRTVASMTLPAARWVVVAMGVANQMGFERPSVSCRLGVGESFDTVELRLAELTVAGQAQTLPIVWTGSFADPRTVRLQCRTDGLDVEVIYLRMIAYKAGTLRRVALR